MFSKACEYGIRAAIYIASQSAENNRVNLKAVASHIDSPEAFTAKILQQLVQHNIITSTKGATGGFEIETTKIETLTLNQVVTAIDGDDIYKVCGLGLKECSEKRPCPVHNSFKTIRDDLKKMLETTSIHQLAKGLKDGSTFLKQ
jgi:Rrf2 family protein